jgi:Zn-dependent protease
MSDLDNEPTASAGDAPVSPWAPYAPPGYNPQPRRSSRWGKVGGGTAAGAGAAAKAGLLAKMLVAFKSAAILVKFKFAATLLVSLLAYTWLYGWGFAVGLVALLAIHEFGHIAAYRAQGVRVSMPTFIPFFGAYVRPESAPRSIAHTAAAALAGPVAGTLAAVAALELSDAMNSPLLRVIAYAGFFISFLNLIPLWILDGARVVRVLHWSVFFGALAVGLLVELARPSRMLPLLIILGAVAIFQRWQQRTQFAADYHATPAVVRSWLAAIYVCIAIGCLWGINLSYVPR